MLNQCSSGVGIIIMKSAFLSMLFFCFLLLPAQSIIINEVVSSNTLLKDGDGESPDWIELFNTSALPLSLEGYAIADKKSLIGTFVLSDIVMPPKSHLLLFASDKNRIENNAYRTIIRQGDSWKYIVPGSDISSEWIQPTFDDSQWLTGNSGFGYGDNDDETLLSPGTIAVFLRKEFNIINLTEIEELILHMDYDDGFAAYINGKEVARRNLGNVNIMTPPTEFSPTDHEASINTGNPPEEFNIENFKDLLIEGDNILAVQVHNVSAGSSDMTAIPYLTLVTSTGISDFPDELAFPLSEIHTNFRLSSEGDSLFLVNNIGGIEQEMAIPPMPSGVSYGSQTDGSDHYVIFESPTPQAPNSGKFYPGVSNIEVEFSAESGKYNSGFVLTLSAEKGDIRFTLDGSSPSAASEIYTTPIIVNRSMTVKAMAFEEDLLSHLITSKSYLIGVEHSIPILSLSMKPEDLWDEDNGIYVLGKEYENSNPYFGANFWEDWERPAHFTYFDEEGTALYTSGAGIKIFGGWSRAFDQKSLSLFARASYGNASFKFPFFDNRPYEEFQALVMRNSGNDWNTTLFRDAMMSSLTHKMNIDYQAYQPVASYLNGSFWGIYNLREKINEHFVASLHGLDATNINLLEGNGALIHGTNSGYQNLKSFVENNSLGSQTNYEYVISEIDEENFIQYQVAQIFFDNTDWPGNNIKFWNSDQTKWRWILFDTDFGFNLYKGTVPNFNTLSFALEPNGPGWPNPPWSTLFLRKLTQNIDFRTKFVNYFADAMNSHFLPEVMNAKIDSCAALIRDDIGQHAAKWNWNVSSWNNEVNRLKTFSNSRTPFMRAFIRQQFGLSFEYRVNLSNADVDKGMIRINSLIIKDASWNGIYFSQNPITLEAIPKQGYVFSHWSGGNNSENEIITVTLNSELNLTAHFSPSADAEDFIVINEINYNSSETWDAGDWVELHNFGNANVNIGGWKLKDNNDDNVFTFDGGTILPSNGFLIIARNMDDFSEYYPQVSDVTGPLGYGLSSNTDAVRLYNLQGTLKDSVSYTSNFPWPVAADGLGPTLELISPELDNALPHHWIAQDGYGSPGARNSNSVSTSDYDIDEIFSVFPNPSNGIFTVNFDSNKIKATNLEVWSLSGQLLKKINLPSHAGSINLNLTSYGPGIYFLRIKGFNLLLTKKLTIL